MNDEKAREIALDLPMKYSLSLEERKALIRLVNISIAIDEIKAEIGAEADFWFENGEDLRGQAVIDTLEIIDKHIGEQHDILQ